MELPHRMGTTWNAHPGNISANHRYSGSGYSGVYGSTSFVAALAEVMHYQSLSGREITSKQVLLENMLDLTNRSNLTKLGLNYDDLVSDQYDVTQFIGIWAREQGYSGIIAPSARIENESNVVVFDGVE